MFLLAARLILAAVFAVAGAAKLIDRAALRQAVAAVGVPSRLVSPVAAVVPLAELAVAAALLNTATTRLGALGALVLLAVFVTGIAVILARGKEPDCGCFGRLHSTRVGWNTLAGDVVLMAVSLAVLVLGPGKGLAAWSAGMSGIDWAMLLVAVVLVVAFVLEGSQLADRRKQNRTIPR